MKKRLDILMVEHGLALNRSKAQALIMSGVVFVDSVLVDKAGQNFLDDINIEIAKSNPFVSRGGLKLLSALEKFKISVADFICLDIGASTGGFTDCLLQNGAKKVYAVDVGKAQLDFKLRQDKRVVSIEQINFRYFDINLLKDIIDFVTIDVSFISLDKILPIAKQCVKSGGEILAMVKPQFELSAAEVKKGVVRDPALRFKAIEKIKNFAIMQGLQVLGGADSGLKGARGNLEHFLLLKT